MTAHRLKMVTPWYRCYVMFYLCSSKIYKKRNAKDGTIYRGRGVGWDHVIYSTTPHSPPHPTPREWYILMVCIVFRSP